MREQLAPAPAGRTLRDVLLRIGPSALTPFLREGPGFRIRTGAPNVRDLSEPALARVEAPGLRYRVPGTGLLAELSVTYSAALSVAVQSVILKNEGIQPSPPLRDLQPLYLPLEVRAQHGPRACAFGGAGTDGFYPPRVYRPEEVCFGEAREWEPQHPSFARWWTGKRHYAIESGPEAMASRPYVPLLLAMWQTDDGEVGLWAALEWLGRWSLQMGAGPDGRFVFEGGPRVQRLVLEPGEILRLPAAHIGVFGGHGAKGMDACNHVRRYLMRAIAPDVEGARPQARLAYDHWFGIEHRLTESLLRRQVDRAAELGVDYFVVDAGWYGGASENYAAGVGNWERVDALKFPDGLEPLAAYVRSRGLRFGLWFEPERGRAGSDWVTQHAEWYLSDGSVNLRLDLAQREAQDALVAMLSRWIERLDIRWLRWDPGAPPGPYWDRIDPTGKVQFAYVEGLYRIWDALLDRHPNLMFDISARLDIGTLRRTGSACVGDHAEDPHIRRLMQTGGARIFPGNYMQAQVYIGEHDPDDTLGPLGLISRMAGSFTLGGHIANWSPRQTARVRRYLDAYRTYSHLLTADFYPLTPYPRTEDDWDVVQFHDPATHEAVLFAYRVRGEETVRVVRPRGLDSGVHYQVIDPFAGCTLRTATGLALQQRGLRLALRPESALVRHLRPVS